MKLNLCNITLLLLIIIISSTENGPTQLVSAHFYPNITSIPGSQIPNASASSWAPFKKLAGCQKGVTSEGLAKLKKYFQLFGYINNSYGNFSDDFDGYLEAAVVNYQLNFNLNATGELDAPTLDHIVRPRCGNPDIVNGTSTMRRSGNSSSAFPAAIHAVAHYSFFPNRPRWQAGRTRLTYAFRPANQLSAAVQAAFRRAFDRWTEVTTLTFAEATGSYDGADIRIGFYAGDHGDGEPFDGVMGTLAHAFAPPVGRLHMDLEENWLVDGDVLNSPGVSAVDLESVAVHEIGHLLGLGHSSVEEAIMYPTISSGTRKVELTSDDIMGVQELYGSNPNYNGSGPVLTPRDERDTSGGAPRAWRCGLSVVAAGLFSFLLF